MAYGQVIDDPNRGMLQNLLMQWMQNSEQRKRDASAQAQEDKRFQQTMGLKQQELDAQKPVWSSQAGQNTAETKRSEYLVSSDRAEKVIAPIIKNYEAIVANGGPNGQANAAAYVKGELSRLQGDPEVAARLSGYLGQRMTLPSDLAAGNRMDIEVSASDRMKQGNATAQDFGITYNKMTGDNPAQHQYTDALQREAGPEAHTAYSAIEGQRAPTANAKLQSETQVRTQGMSEAGAKERTQMQIDAGTGSGATKPAKMQEQYQNLLAKQEKIRSQHSQVTERQKAIAAPWASLSPEARAVAQNRNREWGILERKRIDLEGMGAENVKRIQNIEKAQAARDGGAEAQRPKEMVDQETWDFLTGVKGHSPESLNQRGIFLQEQ